MSEIIKKVLSDKKFRSSRAVKVLVAARAQAGSPWVGAPAN